MAHNKHKPPMLKDPGIEEWIYMRQNYREHFRWTKKTAAVGFIFGVVIPIGLYFKIKQTRFSHILEPTLNEKAKMELAKLDKSKWTSNN